MAYGCAQGLPRLEGWKATLPPSKGSFIPLRKELPFALKLTAVIYWLGGAAWVRSWAQTEHSAVAAKTQQQVTLALVIRA